MVVEGRAEYGSQRAAIESIAGKTGCTAETLRRRVRQHERDTGQREGLSTAEQQRIKDLEREVRELRGANEILKLASVFSVRAELDRRLKSQGRSSISIAIRTRSSRSARHFRPPRWDIGVMRLGNAPALRRPRAQRDEMLMPHIECV